MLCQISAWLYSRVIALRNRYYSRGYGINRVDVPVVSIGNITTGGTGKTPMTLEVGRMLLQRGVRVAIISRGYRRKRTGVVVVSAGSGRCVPVEDCGDELAMIADQLPGAIVIATRRRIDGARLAINQYGVQLVVLDDGFQHRALYRDIDVVMVDQHTLDPRAQLMPCGILREKPDSLHRAHVLCVVDVELSLLRAYSSPWSLVITTSLAHEGWYDLTGSVSDKPAETVVAVSAIARPERFAALVEGNGLKIAQHLVWSDHHWYKSTDVDKVIAAARHFRTRSIVTTEKDAVKLRAFAKQFAANGCVVSVARVSLFLTDDDRRNLLETLLNLLQHES